VITFGRAEDFLNAYEAHEERMPDPDVRMPALADGVAGAMVACATQFCRSCHHARRRADGGLHDEARVRSTSSRSRSTRSRLRESGERMLVVRARGGVRRTEGHERESILRGGTAARNVRSSTASWPRRTQQADSRRPRHQHHAVEAHRDNIMDKITTAGSRSLRIDSRTSERRRLRRDRPIKKNTAEAR